MSASPASDLPPRLEAYAVTDTGRERDENEDAFGCFPDDRLFVVADGMGGRNAGHVAAQMAVDEIAGFFRRHYENPRLPWPHPVEPQQSLGANLLRVGLKVANTRIRQTAANDRALARMACTAIAMAVGDAQVSIAHAGDTRAYRLRKGELRRLTTDHSVLAEMLAARPDMSDEELASHSHRNVVTRALGSKAELSPTVYAGQIHPGDLFLLCSDGLWSPIGDDAIGDMLNQARELELVCERLVAAANHEGGPDNITALLVRIG